MDKKVVKKEASYLDAIGACREAINVDGEQVGLAHEQEVAPENNWGHDQRDAIGRAASISARKKKIARKLMRISKELEALGNMEEEYKNGVEEMLDDDVDYDYEGDEDNKEAGEDDPMSMEMGTDEWLDKNEKQAKHPIEHNPDEDDPEAFADSQMGDDQWIDIGSGSFDDPRDEVGRASK